MATLKTPITFTLEVTVTGLADEPSDRGNYGLRGVSCKVTNVKGVEASKLGAFVPGGGNRSQVSLFYAPEGVKQREIKAPAALPKAAPAKAKAKADAAPEAPDMAAIVAAVMAALGK